MALILLCVFVAAFIVAALMMVATRKPSGPSGQLRTTLESTLDPSRVATPNDEVVDIWKDYSLASIPWVHNLLEQFDAADAFQLILDQADLPWTPSKLGLSAAIACVFGMLGGYFLSGALSVALFLALMLGTGPFVYVWKRRAARFDRFQQAMPDALDLMVSALRAGHSVNSAIGVVATEAREPIRREFNLCFEEQNFGVDLRTALENLVRRVPLADVRIIMTAILIQKESGGNLAEVLEKTAYLVRQRFQLQAQMTAHTAQSRITGTILTIAPFAAGSLLYIFNPAYMTPLFTKPIGRHLLEGAAVVNMVGLVIIRRISKIRA